MAQERDKISRKAFSAADAEWLGKLLSMKLRSVQPLPPRLPQTIEEREADLLLLIETIEGRQFILHLEFQTSNDPKMVLRMALYDYFTYSIHQLEVIGLVIYTGEPPMEMEKNISFGKTSYSCEMIDIRELDPEWFIQSGDVSLVIHALLAGPESVDRSLLIRQILNKLRVLLEGSPLALSESILELGFLALCRPSFKSLIKKELIAMSHDYNYRENIVLEDLFLEEHEKGKLEGILEGILETARRMFQSGLPIELVQQCTQLDRDTLLSIASE